MVKEDYVSFETAKLLKERGFDGECDLFGRTDESEATIQEASKIAYNQGIDDECVIIPTLQMTMKWLREVHKAFISITYENDGVFTANLKVPLKKIDCMIDNKHNCWLTYEEAAEEAIKFCLENLI